MGAGAATDHVLELTAAGSPVREERPAVTDVDSPAFEATRSWRPRAPARENADPRPNSAPQGTRKRKKAKRKEDQKAKKAAALRAAPGHWRL